MAFAPSKSRRRRAMRPLFFASAMALAQAPVCKCPNDLTGLLGHSLVWGWHQLRRPERTFLLYVLPYLEPDGSWPIDRWRGPD